MENILDNSYDESDLDASNFTKPNVKSETEDNNEDDDNMDGIDEKDVKLEFRRGSLSSQDNDRHRKKDYRSKKEIEEEEREKMQ